MYTQINEKVSVLSHFNHKTAKTNPIKIFWDGKTYQIDKIGFHHTTNTGDTLIHIFEVTSKDTYLKLQLNTKTLSWKLLEMFTQH